MREQIFNYVKTKYKSEIEYPWFKFPNYCVFRHSDNRKWYGIIMNIPYSKLGINQDGYVDILNVKISDWALYNIVLQQKGIFKGYHIASGNWVSILLDESVNLELIYKLIDESFISTSLKKKIKK